MQIMLKNSGDKIKTASYNTQKYVIFVKRRF